MADSMVDVCACGTDRLGAWAGCCRGSLAGRLRGLAVSEHFPLAFFFMANLVVGLTVSIVGRSSSARGRSDRELFEARQLGGGAQGVET